MCGVWAAWPISVIAGSNRKLHEGKDAILFVMHENAGVQNRRKGTPSQGSVSRLTLTRPSFLAVLVAAAATAPPLATPASSAMRKAVISSPVVVGVLVRHFPPELRRKEGQTTSAGAVGTGGEEEPPLPRSCPYARPLVQAANGIDSIKRRGNEEERETPSRRLPSRQRGTKGKEQGLPEFRVG